MNRWAIQRPEAYRRVQELYRPRMSSLGYKLLDYDVLSTSKVQVMVQVRRRHPRIQVLVMNNVHEDKTKGKGFMT